MRKSKIGWLKFAMMNVLKVNSTWAAAKTHCRQDWCCEKEGLGCQWAASIGFRGFVDMIMIVLWLYAVDSVWNLISFFSFFFLNPKWSPTALNKKHPSVTQFSQKSKHLTSRAREHRALLGVRSPSASFQQDGTALCGLFVASWTRQTSMDGIEQTDPCMDYSTCQVTWCISTSYYYYDILCDIMCV